MLLAWTGLAAEANNWTGSLQAGAGYWAGETTYSIGGKAWTPQEGTITLPDKISELTFPFDMMFGTVDGSLMYRNQIELHGRVMANLTDPSSKMTDSDWGVLSDDPDTLDVYSRSDATLSAMGADVGARYWVAITTHTNGPAAWIGLGPALLYQQADWTISNVDQWSPSHPELGHQYEPGRAATYSATTLMPYLDICIRMKYRKFSALAEGGVGPVLVQDEDNHMLRQKRSTATLPGMGAKTSLEARYYFTPQCFTRARLSSLLVVAEGTQNQEGYGGKLAGYNADIEETYTSTAVTGDLSFGVAF